METNSKVKSQKSKDFIFAVGRRREAVARVRLYHSPKKSILWEDKEIKKGEILVNKRPIEEYFGSGVAKVFYTQPFVVTNTLNKFIITVRVEGGGLEGQLGALAQGISRALAKLDAEKYRSLLKKHGLLTRDARTRERRKIGMGGKARRKRQSPKR